MKEFIKLIISEIFEGIATAKKCIHRKYYVINIKKQDKFNQNANTQIFNTEEIFVEGTKSFSNIKDQFEGYRLIQVYGGDISGTRESKVVVNIGFGDREYYGFTNEYGQLVKVMAKKIILQDDSAEPVTSSGRYYRDEAKVPGVEKKNLDAGHVIADSLGGVANAYNITPQNSRVNRRGKQAKMENIIREAGGCTDFIAIISYPNNNTQIPSYYRYSYTVYGKEMNMDFANSNKYKIII